MTLADAVNEAISNNLRLLAARFDVTVAEARIIQARLRPNPVLSTGANYLDILGSGFNPNTSTAGPTEVNGRIDFLLERGKKRQERIAVAEAARAVSQLDVLNATRTLLFDVQSAFTDVLLAKENLALTQASLDAFNRIVTINRARVDAGDLAKVELIRSEVASLQFANQVRQAESRLRMAKNRLQAMIGRTAFVPGFDVLGELRREATVPERPDILRSALAARPDLDALKRDQARSLADIRLQLAQGKVDVTVGAGVNRQFGVKNYGGGSSVGVFLSVPLPVYNRNEGEIERARREQQQVLARIRALEQEIAAEVENAHEQSRTALNLLAKIETDMLERARQVREITDFSYRRGEASFVELLDAQRAYNETVQGFNEARAEYARSLFLIDSITGKGWDKK